MKKICLVLALALLIGALPAAGLGEMSAVPAFALSGPAQSVMPGEEFDVVLSLSENPGILAMTLYAAFDPAVLTLTEVIFSEDTFAASQKTGPSLAAAAASGSGALQWDVSQLVAVRDTGALATLRFSVNAGAADGPTQITLSDGASGGAYSASGDQYMISPASLSLTVDASAAAAAYRFNKSSTAIYANMRLIEPWGLRLAAQLLDEAGQSASAVSLYEAGQIRDFGFFFLKSTGSVADAAALAANPASLKASYASRASRAKYDMGYYTGAAEAVDYFSCVFSGFYTYQLGLKFHFVAYAQLSDGSYVYSVPRVYTMQALISSFAGRAATPAGEKALLSGILSLFDAAKTYYAQYEGGRYYNEYIESWR